MTENSNEQSSSTGEGTENSKGKSFTIGEVLDNFSKTAVKIFTFVAGSVGLLYATGFTIVNLDLLRHGVYEVGLVRARFISAGVSYLVLVALLAGATWASLSWVDRLRNNQSWFNLPISFIPISLVCYILAMWVWGFRAVSELDPMQFNILFFVWCLGFSLLLLLMMGGDRLPIVRNLHSLLGPGEASAQISLRKKFSVVAGWSFIGVILIIILYLYGLYIYETFPSALGGGQPIVVQFTGEESSLGELEQIGITQLELGLTDKVELIAQTDSNYIVLVYDSVLKTNVAISFEKSFTKGIKYYPEEHYLSSEYWKEKYTDEGQRSLDEGDFKTAIETFDNALELDEIYIPALIGKGEAWIGLSRNEVAIDLYIDFVNQHEELEENLAPVYYELARAYAIDEQFEEAINALKKAFEWDETLREKAKTNEVFRVDNDLLKEIFQGYENAAIWFGQEGDALKESGDLDGSIEMFESAVSLSEAAKDIKSEANYHYRLSEVYYLSQGKVRETIIELKVAISLTPKNPVYRVELARIFAYQGEFGKAVFQFKQALNINPDDLAARSGLGDTYLEMENYLKAEEEFQTVIEKDSSYASGYYGLARVSAIRGDTADATYYYRIAISLYPAFRNESEDDKYLQSILNEIVNLNTAEDKNNLGNQLLTDGKIEQAINEFNGAILIDSSNAKFHANLSRAYKQQGRLADAEDAIVIAISNAPEEDRYYFLLGEYKFEQKDWESAIDNYAKALGLDSTIPDYHARIAEAFAFSGDLQAAIDEYSKAIDLDQDNPAYLFKLAQTLTDNGNPDEAIPYFNEVWNLDPDYSDAFCGLAMAQQDAGLIEDAQDNLAKCVELSTNELLKEKVQEKFPE